MATVPVRDFPDDGLPFLDTDKRGEEPAEKRYGPLPEEDPHDYERNAGVKKPVGKERNSRKGYTEGEVNRCYLPDNHDQSGPSVFDFECCPFARAVETGKDHGPDDLACDPSEGH